VQHFRAATENDSLDLNEQLPCLVGQVDAPYAPVARNSTPLDPAASLDLIDQAAGGGFLDLELGRYLRLGKPLLIRQDRQYRPLRTRQAQWLQSSVDQFAQQSRGFGQEEARAPLEIIDDHGCGLSDDLRNGPWLPVRRCCVRRRRFPQIKVISTNIHNVQAGRIKMSHLARSGFVPVRTRQLACHPWPR
jgi:hypothetical protein